MRKGKIIATSSMPGCGKSSVTKELGKLLNIEIFNEPEEQSWSDAVKMREVSGNFTALMCLNQSEFLCCIKLIH